MANFTENFMNAMSMIAEAYVKEAKFDRTIQGIVLSCEDEALGKYKIKYQDSIWFAYSQNTSIVYSPNTSVYVLIPGNDTSMKKTILGTVNTLGEDYIEYVSNEDNYYEVGTNFFHQVDAQIELCSYNSKEIILYDIEKEQLKNVLDSIAAKQYLSNSDFIILRANFRTNLPEEQRRQGNYGIKVDIEFEGFEESFSYILDIDDMIGNPYLFHSPLSQEIVLRLQGNKFKRIKKVTAFSIDFAHSDPSKPDDIFISNIQILGAKQITQKQREGTYLRISCPRGYIFTSADTDIDSSRTVIAKALVQGKVLSSDDVKFYWFKRDMSIDAASNLYSPYGGKGWRCLNETINSEDDYNEKFLPGGDTFEVLKTDVPVERVEFKCVAIYNNSIFDNTFQILNIDSTYSIEIVSDKEMAFFNNEDVLTLTCNVKNIKTEEDIETGLQYQWVEITENNVYNTLESTKSINISGSSVINFNDYICSVFMSGDLLGTTKVRIFKKTESSDRYILTLVNGHQLFNYDEAGNSPFIPALATNDTLSIPVLSYTLYDTFTEQDITDDPSIERQVIWKFPMKNSLLVDKNESQDYIIEDDIKIYTNYKNFTYGISNRYYANKTNNNIQLEVTIHDIKLTVSTSLTFSKQGDPGTNGTGVTCKIVPYTSEGLPLSSSKWLVAKHRTGGVIFNWQTLKAELWQNGENIFSSNYSINDIIVTWEMLSLGDQSWYQFYEVPISQPINEKYKLRSKTLTNDSFVWNSNKGWPANIIKVTVQYEGRKYYDVVPIVTSLYLNDDQNGSKAIDIDSYCGFKTVVYSEDGENPQYDNTLPFRVVMDFQSSKIWNWEIVGSILTYKNPDPTVEEFTYGQIFNNLKQDTFARDAADPESSIPDNKNIERFFLKPSTTYDGKCVTNGLIGRYGSDKFIHIPIHFMFNRYGHKNLNDWDGNSIKIDNEQNYILAPQIGAGTKDSEDNTFTGLLMGSVVDLTTNQTENGLFGYNHGIRTIFLDAQTGRSQFGKQGAGQIILDPEENRAIIRSGNYSPSQIDFDGSVIPGTGMMIDLTTPEIKFGSQNFYVNANGELTAKVGRLGPWTLTQEAFYYWTGSINRGNPENIGISDLIYLGTKGFSISDKFIYDINNKSLTLKVSSLTIGDNSLQHAVNTYYTDVEPTLSNYPASNWKTYNERSAHTGDRCYDQNSGKAYSFIQFSNGIIINFNESSETYQGNDYVQIFFEYPKNSGKIFECPKLYGDKLSGAKVKVPNDNFYFYWKTNSTSNIGYGYKVDSIEETGTDEKIFLSDYDYLESELPSESIIELEADTLPPSSSHNNYQANQHKLYHYSKTGVILQSGFNWIEIQDEDIREAAGTANNYLYYKQQSDSKGLKGLYISQHQYTNTTNLFERFGANIRLFDEGMEIYNGARLLAEYGEDSINFYDYTSYTPGSLNPMSPIATISGSNGLSFKKGSITLGNNFSVSNTGILEASNAIIQGDITAKTLTLQSSLQVGDPNLITSNCFVQIIAGSTDSTLNGKLRVFGGTIVTSKVAEEEQNEDGVFVPTKYQHMVLDESYLKGYYGSSKVNYFSNELCGFLDLSANYGSSGGYNKNAVLNGGWGLRLQAGNSLYIEAPHVYIQGYQIDINPIIKR